MVGLTFRLHTPTPVGPVFEIATGQVVTAPKVKLGVLLVAADTEIVGDSPVAVAVIVIRCPKSHGSLLEIASDPVKVPGFGGVKRTVNDVDAPGASENGNAGGDTSVKLGALNVSPLTTSGVCASAAFVILTCFVGLEPHVEEKLS